MSTVHSWVLGFFIVLGPVPALANDNHLAHRLFKEGNYARAAEIFTDPAWKGVALYRSEQWWRAAQAFVRADDVQSRFNLGNCYVRLGYYELALEAYQGVLRQQEGHVDAQHNADLMLALLSEDDEQPQGQGLLQPKELERIATDQEAEQGVASGGEKDTSEGEAAESQEQNGAEPNDTQSDQAQPGASGENAEHGQQDLNSQSGADVSGQRQEHRELADASGNAETEADSELSQSAGIRSQLEADQATEQWLNQIQHDAYRFLQKRIELETNRREAANQAAPRGGSVW